MDMSGTKRRFWVGNIIQTCGFSSKPCLINPKNYIYWEDYTSRSWTIMEVGIPSGGKHSLLMVWSCHTLWSYDTLCVYVWIGYWWLCVDICCWVCVMCHFYVHMSSAFGKSAVCATSLNTQQMTGVRDYYPMCRGDVKEERPPLRLVLLWNHMNPQFFDVINAIQRPYLFVSSNSYNYTYIYICLVPSFLCFHNMPNICSWWNPS